MTWIRRCPLCYRWDQTSKLTTTKYLYMSEKNVFLTPLLLLFFINLRCSTPSWTSVLFIVKEQRPWSRWSWVHTNSPLPWPWASRSDTHSSLSISFVRLKRKWMLQVSCAGDTLWLRFKLQLLELTRKAQQQQLVFRVYTFKPEQHWLDTQVTSLQCDNQVLFSLL